MAATLSINISDQATPELRRLLAAGRGAGALLAAGRGVANRLRQWFASLESSRPNKQGWPRQHFWSQVRKTVQNPVIEGQTAAVTISDFRFRQRLEGGVIRPVNSKFLTIPARSEAYGKRAREFSDLVVRYARGGPVALVRSLSSSLKTKKEQGGETLYWLVKQVTQKPDPGALPPDGELQTAAGNALQSWWNATATRRA